MDQKTIIKRYLTLQANDGSKNAVTSETVGGCQAFVRAFTEFINPLPIDPVMLLIAYEQYQNQIAEEARKIDWLDEDLAAELSDNLVNAMEDTHAKVGCGRQEVADSVAIWVRGQVNFVARSR